jgi:hypothetical protein
MEGVRRLSLTEVCSLAGWTSEMVAEFLSMTAEWSEEEKAYTVGTTKAVELAEAIMWRIATRTALWKDRKQQRDKEAVKHTRAGGVRKRRCLPFKNTALKSTPEERVQFLVGQSISSGTKRTYDSGLRSWCSWMENQGLSPTLNTAEVDRNQRLLCEYAAYRALIDLVSYSTIQVNLFSIRRRHVMHGHRHLYPCMVVFNL